MAEKKIRTYLEKGDKLYNAGDYNGALEMYSNVLKEDLNNKNAKDQIENINRKLDILHQRGQITYEYRESNPQNFRDFSEALENELNQLVDNTNDGTLNLSYSIIFDTMGVNLSFYNILNFNTVAIDKNLPILQSRLSNLLGHKSLQPSSREDIYIRSASTFNINLDWGSYEQLVVKKRKRIVNQSSYALNPLIEDVLHNDPKMYFGKYYFNIKSKSCNDQAYHDINLTKYKTVGGEAFVYGLFPGLGATSEAEYTEAPLSFTTTAITSRSKGIWRTKFSVSRPAVPLPMAIASTLYCNTKRFSLSEASLY